ncbi:MAG: hypothetical protein RLZZ618_1077 [Pseudomonadota bacterium]|jgi:hypothetical protein
MTIEKLLIGAVLALCIVMLVRLCLNPLRQSQMDAVGRWIIQVPQKLIQRSQASRQAAEAIRRAKGSGPEGDWKGNVYTPKSFKRPRKPH